MAKTPKSRKAKGNRLEYELASLYRHHKIDELAKRMPLSGAFEGLKGDIFKPNDKEYVDECKNQERVSLWTWWDQAKSQARGLQKPLLHISANRKEVITVMSVDTYFQLRREIKDLEEIIDELRGQKS